MISVKDITSAIGQDTFTNKDLDLIQRSIQQARVAIGKRVKRELTVGTSVNFISSASGQKLIGTVEKVAIKNVIVRTPLGRYRVPANMLNVD